ncbi:MAG TPA: hypothetical protein VMO47_12615 [Rhodothermales bacterium]|nr:hypothetical protein [Rhodothermales bacterium]
MPKPDVRLSKTIEADRRTIVQNAKLAIRDVFDAIVELVTNADDAYQRLDATGRIEIEVERRRGSPSLLKVRDFAAGMTAEMMEQRLSRLGGRVSGMETGLAVRGTNSRGAKDVAALGRVSFESITEDRRYHRGEISPMFEFIRYESTDSTVAARRNTGIHRGTGTLVTIEVHSNHQIPRHDNFVQLVSDLVPLRDVVRDSRREVIIRDLNKEREDVISGPHYDSVERVSTRLQIPGFPDADAKLKIFRSRRPFEREKERFRRGGIVVKSRHAIHEATLFDPGLESDPHAQWFHGRLVCPYIDDLWNEFDDRFEQGLDPKRDNPLPILDPSRKSGLTRGHPFVDALYAEALKRLRPLVEEERKRRESERATIESAETRKRLDALEKAAGRFMEEFSEEEEEEEPSRDPDARITGSKFRERGFQLSPPFAQVVAGHSQRYSLSVLQDAFPEIEEGATVQIDCLTSEITTDRKFVPLDPHSVQDGVLRATWLVKALEPTPATGIRVRVGPITAESTLEVLATEEARFRHVKALQFSRKRYSIRSGMRRKRIRLLAPASMAESSGTLDVVSDNPNVEVLGERRLKAREHLGIAGCDLTVRLNVEDAGKANLVARLDGEEARCEVVPGAPVGAGIRIKLEDIDLGSRRYRWRSNELEIAARHASLRRYLGSKQDNFPGQESQHFRVLMAEIVADAVCAQLLSNNIQQNPHEYEGADWDQYYAEFSRYMAKFLPAAHKLVLPSP